MSNIDAEKYNIQIDVSTEFIEQRSSREKDEFVFTYTITITNRGTVAAKLLTRHWKIVESEEHIYHVRGEGVVGEQPHLKPGETFRYRSGTVLETPVGTMEGSYQMIADDGVTFDAVISPFLLSAPYAIN